jgi:hypothetical protein
MARKGRVREEGEGKGEDPHGDHLLIRASRDAMRARSEVFDPERQSFVLCDELFVSVRGQSAARRRQRGRQSRGSGSGGDDRTGRKIADLVEDLADEVRHQLVRGLSESLGSPPLLSSHSTQTSGPLFANKVIQ